jgi:hypothetical protein
VNWLCRCRSDTPATTEIPAQQHPGCNQHNNQKEGESQQNSGLAIEDEDAILSVEAVETARNCGQGEKVLLG